jgi:hypothetical protein
MGCIRLADVVAQHAGSIGWLEGREFTGDHLMGTQVFLDIDNKTARDDSGCWLCREARDDPRTEFPPQDWASSG